jgi:hypothetical protein
MALSISGYDLAARPRSGATATANECRVVPMRATGSPATWALTTRLHTPLVQLAATTHAIKGAGYVT